MPKIYFQIEGEEEIFVEYFEGPVNPYRPTEAREIAEVCASRHYHEHGHINAKQGWPKKVILYEKPLFDGLSKIATYIVEVVEVPEFVATRETDS